MNLLNSRSSSPCLSSLRHALRADAAPRVVGLALAVLATGCVSRATHREALHGWTQAEVHAARGTGSSSACAVAWHTLADAAAVTEAELRAAIERAAREHADQAGALEDQVALCRASLDEARNALQAGNADRRRLAERLEELAAIEEELRSRNAIYEDILQRFQALIDDGTLEVVIERGRLVIKLPQDVLFESGRAELGPEGRAALVQVAQVIASLGDRTFQVEGHTDNVPIQTARFPSNWELASARALAVVHLFVETGVRPDRVSAASYSEFQPQRSNDTPDERAFNRRIEIVMVPDLEVIFGGVPSTMPRR